VCHNINCGRRQVWKEASHGGAQQLDFLVLLLCGCQRSNEGKQMWQPGGRMLELYWCA
jgi:hypothetical protein